MCEGLESVPVTPIAVQFICISLALINGNNP